MRVRASRNKTLLAQPVDPDQAVFAQPAPWQDLEPHRGILIMVLGILAFFTVPVVLGPIAWVLGNQDLRRMQSGLMDREGQGMTEAGRICGMIATLLSAAALTIVFLYFLSLFFCCGLLAPSFR
jgi:hypothetical protein